MLIIILIGTLGSFLFSFFVAHSFVSPLMLIPTSIFYLKLVENLFSLMAFPILAWSFMNREAIGYTYKRITNYILAVPELIIDQTIGRLLTGLKNLIFSKPQQQLSDDPTRPRWLALDAPSQSIHVQLDISQKSFLHSERDSNLSLAVETKGDSKADHKNDVLTGEVERFQQIVSAYTGLAWMDVGLQEKYKSGMDKLGNRAIKSCASLLSKDDLLKQKRAFYQVLNLFKDEIITKKDYKCVKALESYLGLKLPTKKGRDISFSDFEDIILRKDRPVSTLSA